MPDPDIDEYRVTIKLLNVESEKSVHWTREKEATLILELIRNVLWNEFGIPVVHDINITHGDG